VEPNKPNTGSFVSHQAQNGDILSITLNEDTDFFVYEEELDDDVAEAHRMVDFLYCINDRFGPQYNKYAEDPINITMYPGPGQKADAIHHIQAFLTDFMFSVPDGLAKKLEDLIREEAGDELS